MTRTVTSPYDVAEHLRTPEEMAAYLEASIEEAGGGRRVHRQGAGRHRPRKGHVAGCERCRPVPREPLQGAFGRPQSKPGYGSEGGRRPGPQVARRTRVRSGSGGSSFRPQSGMIGPDRGRRPAMAFPVDPPFHAEHIGSLVRPPAVLAAREEHEAGRIDAAGLRAVEDAEIAKSVAAQAALGLRSVSDGEFRRRSYTDSFGNRRLRRPQDGAHRQSQLVLYQPGGRDLRCQRLGRRGPAGLGRPGQCRGFPLPRHGRARGVRAQDDAAGPVPHPFPRRTRQYRPRGLSRSRRVLGRHDRCLREGNRRAPRSRLPLHPARRDLDRQVRRPQDPARAGGAGRRLAKPARPLYRNHPGRRGAHARRRRARASPLPRQQGGARGRPRAATTTSRRGCSATFPSGSTSSNTIRRARAGSSRSPRCRTTR